MNYPHRGPGRTDTRMWVNTSWWSLCTLYLLACLVTVTVGDSSLCCVMWRLTELTGWVVGMAGSVINSVPSVCVESLQLRPQRPDYYGRRAQDGHLDFYTAPKLCNIGSCWGIALTVRIKIRRVVYLSSDKNLNEHLYDNNTWRQTTLAVKPKDTETHPRGVGCLHRPHFMFIVSIIYI